ncbi:MAG: acetyl-CoA carboxylase biotin carboxyl carrier protein subunit [Bacteroidia bacterium]|nr:MAG: acetyl-CoA carboxylase biotin carboxyl carrier protein subunit [Bacteroidia bacterium]
MKLNEIQELIKFVSKSNVSEVELETKEFKIVIKTGKNAPLQASTPPVVVQSVPPVVPTVVPANVPTTTPPIAEATNNKSESKPADNKPSNEVADEKKYHVVKSPMIGTFYRSSAPDKPPFVNIGDIVEVGQPLCIIEAMKLFNEIESDVKGRVVKILVENATPVEYDQPLFLIDTNI